MQMLLEEKDLWSVVNGEEVEPSSTDATMHLAFKKKQRKAFIMISLSVADSVTAHIRSCENATDAWNKLVAVHEAKGVANRLFLRDQFRKAAMENGEKMLAYITRICGLVEKLDAIGVTIPEEEVVLTILGGLPSNYTPLVVALESTTDLTLETCCTRLLHEELRRHSTTSNYEADSAFFGKQDGHKNGVVNETSFNRHVEEGNHALATIVAKLDISKTIVVSGCTT